MHLDLDNVEGPAGDYRLEVQERRRQRRRQRRAADAQARRQAAQRGDGAADRLPRPAAPTSPCASAGRAASRSNAATRSPCKPATQILARRTVKPLAKARASRCRTTCSPISCPAPEASRCRSASRPRSTRRRCSRRSTAIRSAAPSRSPAARCRCSTSTISRATAHLALDTAVDQRIRDSIDRLLARQGSNGSFGLWSAGGDDVWLDSYVTDFLTRARERGFAVPDTAFKLALDRLRNFVGNAEDPAKDGGRNLAYALYVLARNGAAPIGDLRYFADTKLERLRDPDRQGADRRRARHARRPRARRAGLCGGACRARAAARARLRPQRLRLDAARCGGAGHAGLRRRRAARDHHRCGRARRGRTRSHALHLDAGERLDGARRPRAGEGCADRVARRRRREDARRAQSQLACRRPRSSRSR